MKREQTPDAVAVLTRNVVRNPFNDVRYRFFALPVWLVVNLMIRARIYLQGKPRTTAIIIQ